MLADGEQPPPYPGSWIHPALGVGFRERPSENTPPSTGTHILLQSASTPPQLSSHAVPHSQSSPPLGSAGVVGGRGLPSGTAGDSPVWGCSLGAASLRGDARVMKTDEVILFSAFLGSIAETAEGLDVGWGFGEEKIRKKQKRRKQKGMCQRPSSAVCLWLPLSFSLNPPPLPLPG